MKVRLLQPITLGNLEEQVGRGVTIPAGSILKVDFDYGETGPLPDDPSATLDVYSIDFDQSFYIRRSEVEVMG